MMMAYISYLDIFVDNVPNEMEYWRVRNNVDNSLFPHVEPEKFASNYILLDQEYGQSKPKLLAYGMKASWWVPENRDSTSPNVITFRGTALTETVLSKRKKLSSGLRMVIHSNYLNSLNLYF